MTLVDGPERCERPSDVDGDGPGVFGLGPVLRVVTVGCALCVDDRDDGNLVTYLSVTDCLDLLHADVNRDGVDGDVDCVAYAVIMGVDGVVRGL